MDGKTSLTDFRVMARDSKNQLLMVYADVTDAAKQLERNHLCGPTAGYVQGEALAGVALLGKELGEPDQTVTFKMDVDGPIGGFLVEASGTGGLRGYTKTKVIASLDDAEIKDSLSALGATGHVEIIRSAPGHLLDSAIQEVTPPSVGKAVEQYYLGSLQRPAAVRIHAESRDGYLAVSRALMVECMPDGNMQEFFRIREALGSEDIGKMLENAASIGELAIGLGLTADAADPKPLQFSCHCSMERVEGMLAGLPKAELEAMLTENRPFEIFCHLCGRGYTVVPGRINAILTSKE